MQLTQDDLLDIIAEASYKLHSEIKNAYKNNCLNGYLASIGMPELIPSKDDIGFESYPDGKILLFGDSNIKEKDNRKVVKICFLNYEFILTYNVLIIVFITRGIFTFNI